MEQGGVSGWVHEVSKQSSKHHSQGARWVAREGHNGGEVGFVQAQSVMTHLTQVRLLQDHLEKDVGVT